jgi:hypothetical protein
VHLITKTRAPGTPKISAQALYAGESVRRGARRETPCHRGMCGRMLPGTQRAGAAERRPRASAGRYSWIFFAADSRNNIFDASTGLGMIRGKQVVERLAGSNPAVSAKWETWPSWLKAPASQQRPSAGAAGYLARFFLHRSAAIFAFISFRVLGLAFASLPRSDEMPWRRQMFVCGMAMFLGVSAFYQLVDGSEVPQQKPCSASRDYTSEFRRRVYVSRWRGARRPRL